MKILQQTHDVIEFVDCFHNIGLQYKSLIPVRINTRPCIFILKKRRGADLSNLFATVSLDSAESSFVDATVTDRYNSVELTLETDPPAEVFVDPPPTEKTYAELLESEDYSTVEPHSSEDDAETDGLDEDNFEELFDTTTASYASAENNDDEEEEVAPRLQEPVLKRAYKSPKAKIKEIKYSQDTDASEEEKETMTTQTTFSSSGMQRPKRNIQKIIKTEKMKQMIDDISKLDLNEFCDLNKMSTKDCLKQIIDDSDAIFET
jgi:alpha-1,6-mannosyltransferase